MATPTGGSQGAAGAAASGGTVGTSGSGGSGGRPGDAGQAGSGGQSGSGGPLDGGASDGGIDHGGVPDSGGPDGAAVSDCANVDAQQACEMLDDCHAVFEDPGICGCAAIGCCARYAFCAPGATADCAGASLACRAAEPFCEKPAFVVSYEGSCYEGCVRPEACRK